MTDNELATEYGRRHGEVLVPLAERLQLMLKDVLEGLPRIDRIAARAKSPDRFMAKALKRTEGGRKYSNPLSQIQDQVGARVIVFYLNDVIAVSSAINKYFRHIEMRDLVPESESEFGYVGNHSILVMPDDVYPDSDEDISGIPKFFELQIKTLFQHAWSEAGHDLAYKAAFPLSSLQKRQLAFTAAQAWGADQMFGTLFDELVGPPPSHV